MDKYNHWLGKAVKRFMNNDAEWAIVIRQTAYYSCSEDKVDQEWRNHENRHKWQWEQEGSIKFIVKYIWYCLKYGYYRSPLEDDARFYAKNWLTKGKASDKVDS